MKINVNNLVTTNIQNFLDKHQNVIEYLDSLEIFYSMFDKKTSNEITNIFHDFIFIFRVDHFFNFFIILRENNDTLMRFSLDPYCEIFSMEEIRKFLKKEIKCTEIDRNLDNYYQITVNLDSDDSLIDNLKKVSSHLTGYFN